ncbi:hypothetical protein PIB30_042161 [Stylosanthes scabra]|uniref:Transmembrane protein n=1 Tax=Stylosanthes scabra TaxID=79078 RepID=A0ABU6QEM1_9FABA|nr:hypothetical protein [Stylosanthes scabra]
MSSAIVSSSSPPSIVEPEQQQQAAAESAEYSSSGGSAWHSSGSVAPFFVVISVLAILAVVSCYLGRRLNRRAPTPLESITGGRGCFGWVKRMCKKCSGCNEVEIVGGVGAKVMACNAIDDLDSKVKDNGEVSHHNNLSHV